MAEEEAANERWNRKFEELKRYKKANGDCEVPNNMYPALGQWLSRQRRDRDLLTVEQRDKLEELGFDISTHQERLDNVWKARYERLKVFKRKYGHTRVPIYHSSESDDELLSWITELGLWVRCQRVDKRDKRIAPWRESLLDAIGFQWNVYTTRTEKLHPNTKNISVKRTTEMLHPSTTHDKRWLMSYQKLCAYRDKNGHCTVPRSYSKDRHLAHWVETQRKYYRQAIILDYRKQLLEDISFVWNPKHIFFGGETNPSSHRKRKRSEPYYTVGCEFYKEFPGCGMFRGEIVSYDGSYYRVCYEDGDEEDLKEDDFDNVYFIIPGHESPAADSCPSRTDSGDENLDRKMPAEEKS